jgi:DNA-binding XRE family transcriptional regulator
MGPKNLDIMGLLATGEAGRDLAESLGVVLGSAMAAYTASLLRLLGRRGEGGTILLDEKDLESLNKEGASAMTSVLNRAVEAAESTKEDSIDSAPAWVQEAYARAKKENSPQEPFEQVQRRVIGNRLILALRERGWSQAELARRVGKKPTAISRILKDPERSRLTTCVRSPTPSRSTSPKWSDRAAGRPEAPALTRCEGCQRG